VLLISDIELLKLKGFVPLRQAQRNTLWQKETFRSGLKVKYPVQTKPGLKSKAVVFGTKHRKPIL
jgi:hypothetical protein